MNRTKVRLFGSTDIVFHTADISRNQNGFEQLKDATFRSRFYMEMNQMMEELKFQVVAVAIRKEEHRRQYGLSALDPYLLSLECIVERFILDLQRSAEQGMIVAECRNSILDNELDLAFLNLKIQGTRFIQAGEIKRRITSLTTRRKSENIPGLQIADLVASPIGRAVLGKSPKPDFEVVKRKFRTSPSGKIRGYGLVVLPKTKSGPATQFLI